MDERQRLIKIFENVREDISNGLYLNKFEEEVKFTKNHNMMVQTERIKSPGFVGVDSRKYEDFPKTIIYVENIDFLDKAIQFDPEYTAVLNPASASRSGGGVRTGSHALEEIICRRSNLIKSLEKFAEPSGMYDPSLDYYEAIWTPDVNVYRDSSYEPMDSPKLINVITMAAINHPRLDSENKYIDQVRRQMKKKIRVVLRIAILRGMTTLVLPAWGCGAFKNPASEVAGCFKEVFEEAEFLGAFEEICFAVLDDHNAKHEFNPEGNFKPFLDTFGLKP